VTPESGPILVTGAAGGVGNMAILMLSGWGYEVVASTGRIAESAYLKDLGAVDIVDRATLSEPGKPLQKERWAGVVDTVGSHTLANACASTRYGGVVTACGLAQGMDFPSTVAPFILRGVKLIGIDSVMASLAAREEAWKALATDLDKTRLDSIINKIRLDQAVSMAADVLAGKVRGRLLVRIAETQA
jgi:acrylyl-CoA reductase (NADPH)